MAQTISSKIINAVNTFIDANPYTSHSDLIAFVESVGLIEHLEDFEISYIKAGGEIHPDKNTMAVMSFEERVAQAERDFIQDMRDAAYDLMETRGSRMYTRRINCEIKLALYAA
jgi:ferredoxin-fold anticodon binding domain-containing protein